MTITRAMLALLAILASTGIAAADPPTLEALLESVRADAVRRTELDAARKVRFGRSQTTQASLRESSLDTATRHRAALALLEAEVAEEARELARLERDLEDSSAELRNLYTNLRHTAAELSRMLAASILSAERPQVLQSLSELTTAQRALGPEELSALWVTLLETMTWSGTTARFRSRIVDADGLARDAEITRIGLFTATTDGTFLAWGAGQLTAPARQPGAQLRSLSAAFEQGRNRLAVIDPLRGGVLRVASRRPTVVERLRDGGLVGYLILAMGAVGALITGMRLLGLWQTTGRMRRQGLNMQEPRTDNPLGRLLLAGADWGGRGRQDLGATLDMVIVREAARLESGQPAILLITRAAPLLGLLGTVTGMIATFASITRLGSGDAQLMAQGIGLALMTTLLGLSVAVPLVLAHRAVAARSRRLIGILERHGLRMRSEHARVAA